MTATQVCDWLKEHYEEAHAERTVSRYVKELREEYRLPRHPNPRSYETVAELPMGQQMQVDFGQTTLKNVEGGWTTVHVAAFLLSHSRYKYAQCQSRPFTAADLVAACHNCFRYWGGMPREMVFDQDSIVCVSENSGDIVYTYEFEKFRQNCKVEIYLCRGADPESKGKIENTVKFIKGNFLNNRLYVDDEILNRSCVEWLERTGNAKIHGTTRKIPAEVFQEEGIDPASTTLKTLVIGAEPHTDEQRRKIERILGVKAYNSFGMTEMNGPGVAFECTEQNGMHLWEDCYLVEIINPETGEPVPDGEIGELVLTTLDREMMPLIRYRTRDLTRILPGTCPCGRTHLRIDRIKGRSDDMFIIKGVNIFPMQVEKVLVQFPELGSNYLITLETISNQDEMIVEVELSDLSTDNYIELEKVRKAISRRLKDEILVTPKVKLVKKGSLPQSEGKAVRVKDLRDNK